jgi:hypothetical protein
LGKLRKPAGSAGFSFFQGDALHGSDRRSPTPSRPKCDLAHRVQARKVNAL